MAHNSNLALLAFAALGLSACGDDPVPVPVDVMQMYPDIQPRPIDGMVYSDTPVSDIIDERAQSCRGGFRGCECDAGVLGVDYCVNMTWEGVCRCGDASPPNLDATSDTASDGAPVPDDASTDGAQQDAAVTGDLGAVE